MIEYNEERQSGTIALAASGYCEYKEVHNSNAAIPTSRVSKNIIGLGV